MPSLYAARSPSATLLEEGKGDGEREQYNQQIIYPDITQAPFDERQENALPRGDCCPNLRRRPSRHGRGVRLFLFARQPSPRRRQKLLRNIPRQIRTWFLFCVLSDRVQNFDPAALFAQAQEDIEHLLGQSLEF